MRLLALAISFAVLVPAASGHSRRPTASSPSAVTFVITGRGWGHGVGLAQYGAFGYAKEGVTYDRILAHYYPGTALGAAPVSRVRVLLAEKRGSLRIASTSAFRVRDGSGVYRALAPGEVKVAAGPTLVTAAGAQKLVTPLTFVRGTSPLALDGKLYRGSLEVGAIGRALQVIDVVGIDQYLYGVVTSEMPHDWPLEALKSQAVAARSYALANRHGGDFDLYADVRSQAYGGIDAETDSARAAVDGTAHKVLLYGGKVADTFFFASSGGRTADVTEVWGAKPVPYLVSVDDPYDTLSPYHRWGPVTLTAEAVGKTFKVAGLGDLVPELGPSGRARFITARGVLGDRAIDGSAFRRALGLRSTWLKIGRLVLDRPTTSIASGATIRLTGSVRSLRGVVLEQRVPGAAWQAGPIVRVAPNGRFAVSVSPQQTSEYRLRAALSAGQPVRLVVA